MKLSQIAYDNNDRCAETVHANEGWAEYWCELVLDHEGSHAIGLKERLPSLESRIAELEAEVTKLKQEGFVPMTTYMDDRGTQFNYDETLGWQPVAPFP